jgi:UDP-galactopyranose mutase
MLKKCDYLIVGAGFYGAVIAYALSSAGKRVIVLDKREHIGGNCYSENDSETGIEFHTYGTHIFHTSNERVWNFISQFCELNRYRHQVLSTHKNKVYQMPINLETINQFYGRNFSPTEAREWIEQEVRNVGIKNPRNLEEKALSMVGRPLYEAFIQGYTRKHWGRDPRELPASIINRLPLRFNYDEDYFRHCKWQGVPVGGYTKIFTQLLSHKNIETILSCDFFESRNNFEVKEKIIYSGPIDRYFDFACGRLAWRSVSFESEIIAVEDYQGTSVMNFADQDIEYTRVHEPRHLHPERRINHDSTLVIREYPKDDPEAPYYPVKDADSVLCFEQYQELAKQEGNVHFGGRLGDYAYYDMDMCISIALKSSADLLASN